MAGQPFNEGLFFWVIVAIIGWVTSRFRKRQSAADQTGEQQQRASGAGQNRERQQREAERAERVREARELVARKIAARRAQAQTEAAPNWRLPRPHSPADLRRGITVPQVPAAEPPQIEIPGDEETEPEAQPSPLRVPVTRVQDDRATYFPTSPASPGFAGTGPSTTLLVGTAPAANLGTADAGTRPTAIAAALPAFAEESAAVAAFGGLADLRGADNLRRAIILREILGKPIGL
ncbi:MAG TPA: hypothetical protein VFE31_09560 [Opitutaceae bacterium]|jgi:hypothetical protein|nr:hypothetical protein [Opitutaceae bacterium]